MTQSAMLIAPKPVGIRPAMGNSGIHFRYHLPGIIDALEANYCIDATHSRLMYTSEAINLLGCHYKPNG